MNEFYVQIHQDVARALLEDVGDADVTADLLSAKTQIQAEIISRECMVVSGQAWVNEVFQQLNEQIKVEWQVKEGEYLSSPQTLCTLSGPAKEILTGERTALNFLQTLSATATQTHRYVQKINKTPTRLLDTRKTIPGLRFAQKYAVTCGGGLNHRMGLYDAILIKENHILACGSVAKAVELARKHHQNILVEVEVESLIELSQALIAQPDRIMLDNFT
jgi:nicotinate-nucleotide pyrophosphorylase (carboxylating)